MKRRRNSRRGATIVEMSIVLGVFVTLTFGMLDLGMGVYRYHIVSNAARHGARRAMVHGQFATVLGIWGPAKITAAASATGVPIINGADDGLAPLLVGCDLAKTTVTVDWPDGNNSVGSRVRVTVVSPYRPFMPFLYDIDLKAVSTMEITH